MAPNSLLFKEKNPGFLPDRRCQEAASSPYPTFQDKRLNCQQCTSHSLLGPEAVVCSRIKQLVEKPLSLRRIFWSRTKPTIQGTGMVWTHLCQTSRICSKGRNYYKLRILSSTGNPDTVAQGLRMRQEVKLASRMGKSENELSDSQSPAREGAINTSQTLIFSLQNPFLCNNP